MILINLKNQIKYTKNLNFPSKINKNQKNQVKLMSIIQIIVRKNKVWTKPKKVQLKIQENLKKIL